MRRFTSFHSLRTYYRYAPGHDIKRSGRGCPRIRPLRVVGDKGYTDRRICNYLCRRGIRLTIPRLSNEPRRGPFNREIYRQRNIVERTINSHPAP